MNDNEKKIKSLLAGRAGSLPAIHSRIVDFRRELHRRPELSGREKETSEKIAALLRKAGLEVTMGIAGYGVKGIIRGKSPGRTIGFRADMDALAILEDNDLLYKSEVVEVMHACGHDGHVAAVAGAAEILSAVLDGGRPEKGNIIFIFQPSEELPPGGAKFMIEDGILDDPPVTAVIGMHNSPNFPSGMIIIPNGSVTAGSDLFELVIKGPGGHGARPERTADIVLMACHFVVLLQSVVSRKFTPGQWPVISVGSIVGGKSHNVIPQEVRLTGTVRSFKSDGQRVKQEMNIILDSLINLFGGSYTISYQFGYPSTNNEPVLSDLVRKTAKRNDYFQWVETNLDRAYVSEDFGYFSALIPACYFIFGVGEEGVEEGPPLHTGRYFMNDTVLPHVSGLLAEIALTYLDS